SVDPDLPAGSILEATQGVVRHEHDNDRAFLHAELKTERGGDQIVVTHHFLLIEEDALAILAAETDSRFDDGGKDENADRLVGEFTGALELTNKAVQGLIGVVLDFGFGGGVAKAWRRDNSRHQQTGEARGFEQGVHRRSPPADWFSPA